MDAMGPAELAALFRASDEELRAGLSRPEFTEAFARLHERLARRPPARIVLAGAGTSGRLAFLLARRHGARLAARGTEVLPWIAGGPRALLEAVEGAEDDSEGARRALAAALRGGRSFFAGISCGLSAPCVAAGLAAAREAGAPAAVFGVNAPEEARARPFPGLPQGFKGALEALLARGDCYVLAPDLGPELLTGSSRLKGGSATWLVFDRLFTYLAEGAAPDGARFAAEVTEILAASALDPERAARWIEAGGEVLRRGGRILLLGRGEAGCAGVLDASECRPTFGAAFDRVRALLAGGWPALLPPGETAPALETELPLDFGALEAGRVPAPAAGDLVVALEDERPGTNAGGGGGAPRAARAPWPAEPRFTLPPARPPADPFLAAKLHLNAFSTGAFVRAGKVFGNRMIDLLLSNTKLFERAKRIVAELAGVPESEALRCLAGALHEVWPPPRALLRLPLEEHCRRARPGVVPLAVLLAQGLDPAEARSRLAAEPILARHLENPRPGPVPPPAP